MSSAVNFEELLDLAKQVLPAAKLGNATDKRILDDLQALSKDIEEAMPKPGAMLAFGFLVADGTEGYTYDWTKHAGTRRHEAADAAAARGRRADHGGRQSRPACRSPTTTSWSSG